MNSIGYFSEKLTPAAAPPEHEFTIDYTTGVSALPIGMMISAPSTKTIASVTRNGCQSSDMKKTMPKPSCCREE